MLGDLEAFAQAAFPEKEWTPEQVDALKDFVMACMEHDAMGEYDDDMAPMMGPKGKKSSSDEPDISLIIGAPAPKKKKK